MEEPKRKKEWTQKPFKIENDELKQRGIVDSKYRLIGKNGSKLRIAKNNYTNEIKMVYRKKNWQQEYQNFFNSLDDKWSRLYSFTKTSSSEKCNEQKTKFCRKVLSYVCYIATNLQQNPSISRFISWHLQTSVSRFGTRSGTILGLW